MSYGPAAVLWPCFVQRPDAVVVKVMLGVVVTLVVVVVQLLVMVQLVVVITARV
jgi:hypothetical protein